jgi:endoglucanase Acf2
MPAVADAFLRLQLTFKELQESSNPVIQALDWDDMGLTMSFAAGPAASTGPRMSSPLVKGSPFLTAQYPLSVKPILRAPRAGAGGGGTITSVTQAGPNKLKIVVSSVPVDGTNTWLLWASKPISFTASGSSTVAIWDPSTGSNEVQGSFAGTIRMAWVPNDGAPGAAATTAMLDAYVNVVTVGGSVKAWSNSTAQIGSYAISWSTQLTPGLTPGLANQPLMLALPHLIDTLALPTSTSSSAFPLGTAAPGSGATVTGSRLAYTSQPPASSGRPRADYGGYVMSVRGPLVPVAGSCWVLQEQLVPLESEMTAAANLKNSAWRANIEQTLLVRAEGDH